MRRAAARLSSVERYQLPSMRRGGAAACCGGMNSEYRKPTPAVAGRPPSQSKEDKRRIQELERDLKRKNAALAETTALLVLSKEMAAIFRKGEDE